MTDKNSNTHPPPANSLSNEKQVTRTLRFDPDDYRAEISEYYATQEQQDEVLRILWDIMQTFVDIGWGVESVQMAFPELFEKAGADSDKLLEQKRAKLFNEASNNRTGEKSDK